MVDELVDVQAQNMLDQVKLNMQFSLLCALTAFAFAEKSWHLDQYSLKYWSFHRRSRLCHPRGMFHRGGLVTIPSMLLVA